MALSTASNWLWNFLLAFCKSFVIFHTRNIVAELMATSLTLHHWRYRLPLRLRLCRDKRAWRFDRVLLRN